MKATEVVVYFNELVAGGISRDEALAIVIALIHTNGVIS